MAAFPDTSWTAVCQARERHGEDARRALARLLTDYAAPVVAYVQRFGMRAEEVEDVVQSFLTSFFLEGIPAGGADRQRGRFRSYLCGALHHFLLNWQRSEHAAKRQPSKPVVSLDDLRRSSGSIPIADDADTPERAFDRQWARGMIAQALCVTRLRLVNEGREDHWRLFERLVVEDATETSYRDVAQDLAISEAQVRYRLHAARGVFARALRALVAETVTAPAEVDSELRALLKVFS